VRQPIQEMARVAVDLLVTPGAEPSGQEAEQVLDHHLVVRDSTAARPGRSHRLRPEP
jgi:DNA-binding LacI/PurR family transcriptional regulator